MATSVNKETQLQPYTELPEGLLQFAKVVSVVQKNFQSFAFSPELANVVNTIQKNVISIQKFIETPGVQEQIRNLQKTIDALQKRYENSPEVKKDIEDFKNVVLEAVSEQDFQDDFNSKQTDDVELDFQIFVDQLASQIDFDKAIRADIETAFKSEIISLIVNTIFILVLNWDYSKELMKGADYFINGIEAEAFTTSRIKLRAQPSFEGEELVEIPRNSVLKVYKGGENGWVKISVNLNNIDVEGYVNSAYIKSLPESNL